MTDPMLRAPLTPQVSVGNTYNLFQVKFA